MTAGSALEPRCSSRSPASPSPSRRWRSAAPLFALAAALVAVLGLYELYSLTAAARPLRWAGYLGTVLIVALAWGLGRRASAASWPASASRSPWWRSPP